VFGLGKGSIELKLNNFNYSYGGAVKGTLVLKLKQPTQARGLRVKIRCTRTGSAVSIGPGSGRRTETQVLYEAEVPLGGEQTYNSAEFPFEVKIPAQPIGAGPGGALGQALGVASMFTGGFARTEWVLDASLDIAGGFDVNKKLKLNIG